MAMVSSDNGQLSLRMRILGRVMRALPTDIRRFYSIWLYVYDKIGGGGYDDEENIDAMWPRGLQPPVLLPRHHFKVRLEVRFWHERRAYFSGGYYQADLERLMEALIRPGDQYIDVGANIGLVTLLASRLIGPGGCGLAFEPNPQAFERLSYHLSLNSCENIKSLPLAISDSESIANLVIPHDNMGLGSLAPMSDSSKSTYTVSTAPVDSFIHQLDANKETFVKIDVEGYECQVLGGMTQLLKFPELAVVAEVNDSMLRRAGHSREALHRIMSDAGFIGFRFDLKLDRWNRWLQLDPVDGPQDEAQYDVLFVRPDSKTFERRVKPLISRASRSYADSAESAKMGMSHAGA